LGCRCVHVNVKTLKTFAAVLCVAGLAVPAGVLAKGPSGNHGNPGEPHGPKNHTPNHVSKRCKHQPSVGFTLHGTLDPASTDADNIIVDNVKANHHAKPWVTNGQFTVTGQSSKVHFVGANPFTTAGADKSQYKVVVIGKVAKLKHGCTADNSPSPTIRKVMVIAPGSGESGSNTESGSNDESGGNQSGSNND
jgi:hypothetical protein